MDESSNRIQCLLAWADKEKRKKRRVRAREIVKTRKYRASEFADLTPWSIDELVYFADWKHANTSPKYQDPQVKLDFIFVLETPDVKDE